MTIQFKSIDDLNNFKRESGCNDYYVVKDFLSLVGTFTESNLHLATDKFNAMVSVDRQQHS